MKRAYADHTAESQTQEDLQDVQQHSPGRSILLHLLPGAIITILFFFTAGLAQAAGFPPSFALLICTLVVLFPTLGHLLLEGKRRNGKWSLKGIVLYRQRTPLRQYIWIVPLVTIWGLLVYIATTPLQLVLIHTLFFWWPALLLTDAGHYSQINVVIVTVTTLLINGLVGPMIEEVYFRGYLLPRIAYFGKWAPVINLFLFSLYHFWQPWQNLTNLLGLWPFIFLVWKKQDIRLSIVLHCTLNMVGMLLLLGAAHAGH
ncbi:MAG TPA: CPBP family intramembrane glutamic endopeptidase [Ktedonobacteraceae bacterium]